MTRTVAIAAALLALAMTASAASANAGPVGQWRLDDGGGSLARDSSGFGDNGAIVGGVSWTSGPSGAAASFDGVTGRIRIPDAPQLEPSAAVSIAAWVARVGSPGTYKYILAKGGNGCTSAAYGLYSGPSGGLEFYIARGHGTIYARSPDAGWGVWDGRWHLAVGTFDGTTIRLYVDGAEVGFGTEYPGPIDYQLNDTNDLFIGDYPSCRDMDFPGAISDVRVWNRALSAAEVSGLSGPSQQPPAGGESLPSTAPVQVGAAPGNPGGGGAGAGGGGAGSAGAGSAAGAPPSHAPVIGMVSVSSSNVTLGAIGPAGRSTPVIAYHDSDSSRVTFTILQVQSKAMHARCISAARHRHRSPVAYCPRRVSLGRFVHQDHRGHNMVRFPRALTPSPGDYVLDLTPSLNGNVGKTVAIPFRVVAAR